MNARNIETYFFLAVFLGVSVLIFFIFKPFIFPLILALIFVTIFDPVHKRVLAFVNGRSTIAALISTIIVLLVVVIPLSFMGYQILQEVRGLYLTLSQHSDTASMFHGANSTIQKFLNLSPIKTSIVPDVEQYLTQGLIWLSKHLGQIFLNIASMVADIFILLMAMYYLFKDGDRLKKAAVIFSPLKDIYDEAVITKLALAIRSVIGGNIIVAVVQGLLTAVGFIIFGVPNPILWGSLSAIASLVPTVGTSLVIVPAILYLFFTGHILFAGGLLVWGFVAVGLVDNYLGPKLVSRGTKIHPLLILLSVLGGIALFGPMGFILGPLVLSLVGALMDIHLTSRKERGGY